MDVRYRESFLRDLRKLKGHPLYPRIFKLAFETLPEAPDMRAISGVKAMTGHSGRYRVQLSHRH